MQSWCLVPSGGLGILSAMAISRQSSQRIYGALQFPLPFPRGLTNEDSEISILSVCNDGFLVHRCSVSDDAWPG